MLPLLPGGNSLSPAARRGVRPTRRARRRPRVGWRPLATRRGQRRRRRRFRAGRLRWRRGLRRRRRRQRRPVAASISKNWIYQMQKFATASAGADRPEPGGGPVQGSAPPPPPPRVWTAVAATAAIRKRSEVEGRRPATGCRHGQTPSPLPANRQAKCQFIAPKVLHRREGGARALPGGHPRTYTRHPAPPRTHT